MENKKRDIQAPLGFPVLETQRTVDFVSRYANNVQIEASAWDMKLIFGLLDQRPAAKEFNAPAHVEQHTAINISWPEVKVLIFLMQLQLAGHEKENGKVKVPVNAIPPEPPTTLPDPFNTPENQAGLDMIRRLRAEFLDTI